MQPGRPGLRVRPTWTSPRRVIAVFAGTIAAQGLSQRALQRVRVAVDDTFVY
jgi:hypothetical protein